MKKELQEIPKKLNKKQTLKSLKKASKKMEDSRLELGQIWNACEYGEKAKLFEDMGYKKATMKKYGIFANEQEGYDHIPPYTLWDLACNLKVKKADRPELLEMALEKGWNNAQLRGHLKPVIETTKAQKEEKERQEKMKKALENDDDYGEDEEEDIETPIAPQQTPMDIDEALLFLGFDVEEETITREVFDVLYRHYAKKYHPDTGGDPKKMVKLTEVKTILKGTLV